jgi:hypothetical protein
MANYITIATTIAGTPTLQFNTSLIGYVHYASATSIVIYSGPKAYTLTVSGATTTSVQSAINKAILNPSGPIVVPVDLGTATVTAIAIA